ncbi:putative ABC transport system ATP-binding protein [Sporosarcina luteola]|nr:putative ABC transport system ATP-binding protein [Sporosarcina luteola]
MDKIVEMYKVDKSYNAKKVLTGFNLDIYKGEMLAIKGKSGSGKSTILNLIGLLEKEDSGIIKLFGQPKPPPRSRRFKLMLRNKISYLFQNFALIEDISVEENLKIPLIYSNKTKKEKQKNMLEALENVGLGDVLRMKVHELSGGEQQRVAIARILLRECQLILADEPTGSLDPILRDEIIDILEILNQKGITIVIVTHDSVLASRCHRIIELN